MERLDPNKIIDPRIKLKLGLLEQNQERFQPTIIGPKVDQVAKNSGKRLEKQLKELQTTTFDPILAMSKVLASKEKSKEVNRVLTEKVFLPLLNMIGTWKISNSL
jgi:hypothetical protein